MLAAVFAALAVAVFAVAVASGSVAVFSIAAVFVAAIVIVAVGRAGEYGNNAKSCCKKFIILHRFNNGL